MDLRKLSQEELLNETRRQVRVEKEATLALIDCLKEIDSRKLYLALGFSSLHEFVIRELGLSEGSAHRRISAARLMVQVPEVKVALETGAINLTTVVMAQSAFRKKRYSVAEKKEVLKELESKSKSQVERKLAALCPELVKPDQLRVLNETHSELKISVSQKMLDQLDRLRGRLAHTHANASTGELLEYALELALKKLDPSQGGATKEASTSSSTAKATKNIRYIPVRIKKIIWEKAQGACEFVSQQGKKCGSRFALQVDHVKPVARGGETTVPNLRLLCAAHNRYEAGRILGSKGIGK